MWWPANARLPASATDTHGDTHLSAYALGGAEGMVLALATRRREAGDHTVAGIAVVLLSLLAAPHQGADAAGRSAALVRMLLGADPAEVAPLLGATGPWTVVHARRTDGTPADALTAGALGASLGTALVDAGRGGGEAVRLLLPGAVPQEEAVRLLPGAVPQEEAVRPLPEADRVTPQPGWTLGASAPTPVTALDAADALAARALAHARATRAPLAVDTPCAASPPWSRPNRQPPTPAPSSPRSPHRWPTPCAAGSPCTATGTVRRWRSASTATRCANASGGAGSCWTRTWTTWTYGRSCGSRCGRGERESQTPA